MCNASATASVIVSLAISSVGASAFADTIYDFEGTCSDGCTGTATGVLVLNDSYTPGTALQREDFVSFTYTSGDTTVTYNSFPSPDTSPGGPFQGILPTLSGPSVEWVEIDGPSSGTGLNACGVVGIPDNYFCPSAGFWSFEWRPLGIIRDFGPSHTWTRRGANTVSIDIKPGSDPNCFNINGHGVIPVAILGETTLDVTTIDVDSLLFDGLQVRQRKGRALCSVDDVNDDAYWDLVCRFEDVLEDWVADEDEAALTGTLYDGTSIEGTDSICLAPNKG